MVWGNTYKTNTLPLTVLQKKAIYTNHYHFGLELNLLKFVDIVNLYAAMFMLQYSQDCLPPYFDVLFNKRAGVFYL
jgi:hypothetical protein